MPSTPARRLLRRLPLLCIALATIAVTGGCDSVKPNKSRAEELEMYDFSSAIRWGDFDAAYDFVDPKVKADHPLTDLDRERYKQVEISGYEVIANVENIGVIDRQIKLDLINRNTQIPRSMTYHEHWVWDEAKKYWWLETGLPDISPQN